MSSYEIQSLLKRFSGLDASPAFQPFSGVEIKTGTKDSSGNEIVYSAGDASGRVLTIENQWGTQAQANNILAQIKGFTYQPYSATDASLDPAAELGDGVSLNKLYSGIYKISRDYTSLMSADIEAPQDEEIDHEYPFESKAEREIARTFSVLESRLSVQSGEISAKVSVVGGENNSVSWSLTKDAWTVKANGTEVFKINSGGATVEGKIKAKSGEIGAFTITSDAISTGGKTYGDNKNGIYFGSSGIALGPANNSNFRASKNGSVVAHNMKLTGTLTIGNQTITADTLRSGAQSAYNNGSYWTGGAGGGYSYTKATTPNTTDFPGTFKCGRLTITQGLAIDGNFSWGGYLIGRTTIKDYNGVSRNVLSWQ